MSDLSDEQLAGIYAWWKEAAELLRLQAWTLQLQRSIECDDDAYASIKINEENRWLILRIHRDFFELRRRERKHTLTHEIAHVVLADFEQTAAGLMDPLTARERDLWDRCVERTTDRLADLLVERMPRAPF